MPPKKQAPQTSKKTEQKKKEKIIEDKTFGLKNKKGAKNQKFIQQVQKQVQTGGKPERKVEAAKKDDKKKEKEDELKLFRPVTTQKVEKGADPKSVLCAFFKQGNCGKGDKCKFSHDLTIERKAEKKSIYVDMRDDKQDDTMENWDEEKLKEVVETKHGGGKMPSTEIICKFFVEALELSKYGWFWECPNGGDKCHYRHALPPGFVLNKDKKKAEKASEISIEELVEVERAKLGYDLPKITLETFVAWKKKKIHDRETKANTETERKKAEFKAGRSVGLSGRDMFTFRPELAQEDQMDEDEAAFDSNFRENEEDALCREIDVTSFETQYTENDGSGTQVTTREYQINTDERSNNLEASGGVEDDAAEVSETAIDETLFDEEDLDDLEKELNTLTVD